METKLTIRQARRLAEKTQAEVAFAIGVCEHTYRKIENSPQTATMAQLLKIASYLNVPFDCLFFETEL